jgi:hypothetical protein
MSFDFSVVRQDRFIEATRDSGYKGTDSALSELIDNAIQAKASRVAIRMRASQEESFGPGKPRQPRVTEVAIADNGRGMDSETLRRALRFGDSTRFNDRTGLGRYGMGLPNASVSQATRVEVYTWRRGKKPTSTYIDVDEISNATMVEIPEPEHAPIPEIYQDIVRSPSGTLVIWKNCDRLDHDGKLDTLLRGLRPSLGRMFRHFLVAGLSLSLNDVAIGPIDPMFLMPQASIENDALATAHGDTLAFEIPIPGEDEQMSTVEVSFSLIPEEWQLKHNKDREFLRTRHIDGTTGFSIVRARREIDLIKSPYHAKHWTDTWYRVEIRFDPELDELFGVTHTKQHAKIRAGSEEPPSTGASGRANCKEGARSSRANHGIGGQVSD